MGNKKTKKAIGWYLIVIVISLMTTLPFIWTISTSFKSEGEILSGSMNVIPKLFTLDNYKEAIHAMPFFNYMKNSLIIAVTAVFTELFFGSLAGYAFGQLKFKAKNILFIGFLATMMIPGIVTMIPSFIILRSFPLMGGNDFLGQGGLGLINTYWALIIPNAAGPFAIFMMKQFFEGLPRELGESARMDGGSEFQIFFKVYLPLSKPALATLGIMTFQGRWNSFLWPMIVLNSDKMKTVQVGLATFQSNYDTSFGPLMAGSLLATLPILVIFIFAQKYYVQGIAESGIK